MSGPILVRHDAVTTLAHSRALMEFIGDLERAFATSIYPNRIPIAIGLVLATLALARTAIVRRWDLVARRHPGRTALVAIPLLAAGLPLAWYLGSPLFISTSVDEAAPTAPAADGRGRSGAFSGADEFHFGRGTARIVEAGAGGAATLRLEDFEVRNGPDLYIYLSPSADGYADGAIELGRLKADKGNQNYDIPAGTDLDSVRSVVIWCRQFAVQFAAAPLG